MAILLRGTAEKYESRGSIASDRVSYIEIVDVGSRFFQPRDCIDIRVCSIFHSPRLPLRVHVLFSPPSLDFPENLQISSRLAESSLFGGFDQSSPNFGGHHRIESLAGVDETATLCVYRIDWKLCAATRY